MKRSCSLLLCGAAMFGAAVLATGAACAAPASAVVAFDPGPGGFHPGGPDRPGDRDRDSREDGFRDHGGPDRGFRDHDFWDHSGPDNARGIGSEMRHEWSSHSGDGRDNRTPRPHIA